MPNSNDISRLGNLLVSISQKKGFYSTYCNLLLGGTEISGGDCGLQRHNGDWGGARVMGNAKVMGVGKSCIKHLTLIHLYMFVAGFPSHLLLQFDIQL